MAVCLAAGLPADGLSWTLLDKTETKYYEDASGNSLAWGSFACHDERLDRFVKTSWMARLDDFENSGVGLHGFEEAQGDAYRTEPDFPFRADADAAWPGDIGARLKNANCKLSSFAETVIPHTRLPEVVRGMLYRKFSGGEEGALLEEAANLGTRAVPFLTRARRHGARVPDTIVKSVTSAFERRMEEITFHAVKHMCFDAAESDAVQACRAEAWNLGLDPSLDMCWRAAVAAGQELLHWWTRAAEPGWFEWQRTVELQDGADWLAPSGAAAHGLRHASAGGLSDALGRGLAVLVGRLEEAEYLGTGAVERLPLVELLEFMTKLGLDPRGAVGMGIAYWDFLDLPLAKIARKDPRNIVAGAVGEKIRRVGDLLGYDAATVGRRIGAAIRSAERISGRLKL
jgi:hypothetical protein